MTTEMPEFKMGDHEAWHITYDQHEILVINKGRTRLVIDGEEVAVQKGRLPIATKLNLIGTIKETGELVIVTLNGSLSNEYRGCKTEVHVYIGKELESSYGYVDSSRKFTKFDGPVRSETANDNIKRKKKKKISIGRKRKDKNKV